MENSAMKGGDKHSQSRNMQPDILCSSLVYMIMHATIASLKHCRLQLASVLGSVLGSSKCRTWELAPIYCGQPRCFTAGYKYHGYKFPALRNE